MRYITPDICYQVIFPFVYEELADVEQAPSYEQEANGIRELTKVLTLVQQDSFYPTFHAKAAYLLCSIAGSQYFSNGNKRLAVVTLFTFLALNQPKARLLNKEELQALLAQSFPRHTWEENASIKNDHALFLYNLTLVIGDRSRWSDGDDFSLLKDKIAIIFEYLYRI